MLPIVMAIAIARPPSQFVPPSGWVARAPSREMQGEGLFAVWLPAKPDGENIMLVIHPRSKGESLDDAVAALSREERADGRTVASVRSHPTCGGTLGGRDVDMRFAMVSQLFHVAVKGELELALIYTHRGGDPVPPNVMRALDSFCPR